MTIDIHVHAVLVKELTDNRPELLRDARELFDLRTSPQPLSTLLGEMDDCNVVKSVLLPINCEKSLGSKMPSNSEIADLVRREEKRLIGFSSVDPNSGKSALSDLRESHDALGLKGLKLNPAMQAFDPSGAEALETYKEAEKLEMPILIHTGLTFSNRFSIRYNQPSIYDDVARKHPKLKLCLAHMGWPWVWDAVAVTIRNPNVYLDTAGTYAGTPTETMKQITSLLSTRVIENTLDDRLIFGSDYPRIEMNKMFNAVSSLPLRREVLDAILHDNALAFLGDS
ncbi:MAG: amidohydrolase family protein [Candidatus Bathyarchaeia archaeon]